MPVGANSIKRAAKAVNKGTEAEQIAAQANVQAEAAEQVETVTEVTETSKPSAAKGKAKTATAKKASVKKSTVTKKAPAKSTAAKTESAVKEKMPTQSNTQPKQMYGILDELPIHLL